MTEIVLGSLPFEGESFDEIFGRDLLDRHPAPRALMSELYRVAKPGCQLVLQLPHGASDAAWTHPKVLRPYFPSSFLSFSQPFYWRGDEGYSADWQPSFVLLKLDKERYGALSEAERLRAVQEQRNVVSEMTAVMVAVKPARPKDRRLLSEPQIELLLHER